MNELVLSRGQIPPARQVTNPDGNVSYVADPVVLVCSWDASTMYLGGDNTSTSRVRVDALNAGTGTWSQVGNTGGLNGVLLQPSDTNHRDLGPGASIAKWVLTRIPNGEGDTMQGGVGYELRQTVTE